MIQITNFALVKGPTRNKERKGKRKEAKRHHFEDEELLGYVNVGVAGGAVLEAALARGGEGETHEDGDREEGVHVHQAV